DRWQSAADVARELTWIADRGEQASQIAGPAVPARTRRRVAWLPWSIAAIMSLAALAALTTIVRGPGSERIGEPMRFVIPLPETAGTAMFPAVSPDGRHIAFLATFPFQRGTIWVR